jgi:prepilin-type N-terminal cleavage/methylation domain-containing protein
MKNKLIHSTFLLRRQRAFTLTELLISVILISIMAVTIGMAMFRTQQRAKETRSSLVSLQTQGNVLDRMSEELRWAQIIHSLDAASINFMVSSAGINTNTMSITPGDDFNFSSTYDIWRIEQDGGGFTGVFTASTSGNHTLKVTHLSAYSAMAPGNGYSPVTIRINSGVIVSNYDPASNHGGSHDWVTDTWVINANNGNNTLSWTAENLYTHYWIQKIEIIRESQDHAVYAEFTTNPIVTGATDSAAETIDYTWDDINHTLERSVNGQAAVTVMEDVYLFDLQQCDFGWDDQSQRYLRGIKIIIQTSPDIADTCERYVHLVNYPYW